MPTELQEAVRRLDNWEKWHEEATDSERLILEAARQVVNGTEIRYCLWHERRAADNSGDEGSGVIPTRFCSSQDGSHDCVVETRLLIDVIEDE